MINTIFSKLFKNKSKKQIVESNCLRKVDFETDDQVASKLLIKELLKLLKKEPSLKKVYLYGSRARGDHSANSDHDFYAVYGDDAKEYLYSDPHNLTLHTDYRIKIIRELRKNSILTNIDLMAARQKQFDELKIDEGSHAWQCLEYGKKIYDQDET